ncbi:hypothetical protein HDE_03949 [Halotydeus destructor]|nr:hypothetical protein HDE_03949 [Halotydeus destructor]
MAAKLFVLLVIIGQTLATEKLNCHLVQSSLSQVFDSSSSGGFLNICDRVVVGAGSPLKDGTVEPLERAVGQHFRNAKDGRPQLEFLVEVSLGAQALASLITARYRVFMAQALKTIIHDNELNGVVLNLDQSDEKPFPSISDKYRVLALIGELRMTLGKVMTIGVVMGKRGPFMDMDRFDCKALNKQIDFLELSAKIFDLGANRTQTANGPSRPMWDGPVDQKAFKLTKALVDEFEICTQLRKKIMLTIPLPTGIKVTQGQPKAESLSYSRVCNKSAIWYEGADLPLVTLAGGMEYWVSLVNSKTMAAMVQYGVDKGVAGFSFSSINFDDREDKCGQGSFPLLNQLARSMGKRPVQPEI